MNPSSFLKLLNKHIEKSIIGKHETIRLLFISLISNGHVLIEDVPGVGKTSLISAIANSFSCSFHRMQFTPDITPSDVVGFSMYKQKEQEFEFQPGAVFCQFLLVDEINRAPAKTQSSLLEVMEEHQVSVDAHTYSLPTPFTVFATQNPIEYHGTFPLPEAQLDRFFMKLQMGYPDHSEEMNILSLHQHHKLQTAPPPIATPQDLISFQQAVDQVYMSPILCDYIVTLMRKTRSSQDIVLGASPRATLALAKASRAAALLQNRDFVIPDDVQQMMLPIISHRIHLTQQSIFNEQSTQTILTKILQETMVPTL